MSVEKRIAAVERLIPKKGYNLVGVDEYEDDPEHELYLIGHYDDYTSADRELRTRMKKDPRAKVYIYDPSMREKSKR